MCGLFTASVTDYEYYSVLDKIEIHGKTNENSVFKMHAKWILYFFTSLYNHKYVDLSVNCLFLICKLFEEEEKN